MTWMILEIYFISDEQNNHFINIMIYQKLYIIFAYDKYNKDMRFYIVLCYKDMHFYIVLYRKINFHNYFSYKNVIT